MDLKNCYNILEIQQTASLSEIKQAYRDMIGIWHPDRYAQNPRLHEKATEKLKELNVAYNQLITHLTSDIVKSDARPKTSENETDGRSHGTGSVDQTSGKKAFSGQAPFQGSYSKRKRRFWNKWMILLSIASIGILIANAGDIHYKFIQGLEQISGGRYARYFKDPPLRLSFKTKIPATASTDILHIQQSLKKFGYDTDPLDGIWGERTLAAVQQFRNDYFLEFRVDDLSEITSALQRQYAIVTIHPDWPQIARDRRFKLWTEQQVMTSPKICRKLLSSGKTDQVGSLIDWYKFDRLQPKPMPLPRNGTLKKSYLKGFAPFTITTRNDGRHYYLKLLNASNGSETLTAFMRSGSTLAEHVPVGKYELKYALGSVWYGIRWFFGPKTVFRKMDQVFEFKIQNNEISGYRLDLYLQATDPAGTGKDYAFDF